MTYSKFMLCAIILSVLFQYSSVFANEEINRVELEKPINTQGTISFILNIDSTFQNGIEEELFDQELIKLPGVGSCLFEKDNSAIFIYFQWDTVTTHQGYYLMLRELPGPEKYHILFTWDADNGISDGYFNGIPFRMENDRYYRPWEVIGTATEIEIIPGEIKVLDLVVSEKYMSQEEVQEVTPKNLYGKKSFLLGKEKLPQPVNVNERKGKLLYASRFDNKESLNNWILEGPAIIDFVDSAMILRSEIPNPPDGSTGHFNYWCPVEFPDKIIVEWEFKPLTDNGVCHIFFSSKGKNGQDVFDSTLPKRDGHFDAYINGEIDNYYIIYFSNRRIFRTSNMARSWLSKTSKQMMLSLGHQGVIPSEKRFHKMQLIKDGGHIQLLTDGVVCLDFMDPGTDRWGSILGGGKISFRQMAATMAMYRNFKVWELK